MPCYFLLNFVQVSEEELYEEAFTCYFLLNFVGQNVQGNGAARRTNNLLFSFEFCSLGMFGSRTSRSIVPCYFLLNFVTACRLALSRCATHSSLLFSFEFCNGSKMCHACSRVMLLRLLFSFEFCL